MKFLFASDVSFNYFTEYPGDAAMRSAVAEIKPFFDKADFSMLNLESTFGARENFTPIKKSGPNQISDARFAKFLEELSPSAVSLANNHTGDYGECAIFDTIKILDGLNIAHTGAGENKEKAYEPVKFEKDGEKYAFFGVCENEFGIATSKSAGSAGYSLGRVTKAIFEAKKEGYVPVIFFHGGNEHNAFPSPKKVELYRHFVDLGAGAVIAMHTHCPQGYEIYEGAPIVYSMGNFFFPAPDYAPDRKRMEVWHVGYMTDVEFTTKGVTITPIPYRQSFDGIRLLRGDEYSHFTDYLEAICRPIGDEEKINEYFEAWVLKYDFLSQFKNFNEESLASDSVVSSIKNLLGCEAHNEFITTEANILFEGRKGEAMKLIPVLTALQNMAIPEELK